MTDDLAFNGYDDKQPGLGAPYPRMMYRPGGMEKIHGFAVDYVTVESEAEEDTLASEGWALSPQRAYKPLPPTEPDTRDAEIAALKAQLAAQQAETDVKRGPGRPPKQREEGVA